jgi:hypothetical protein
MRFGTSRVGLPALLVLCSLLTACGSGSDPSAAEPDIGDVPLVRDYHDLALPLDGYALSTVEYSAVRRAAWRLVNECVTSFGGRYTVPEALMLRDVPQFDHPHARRYGVADEASAAARGYNLPPAQRPPSEGRPFEWKPSEAELLLVRGRPADADVPAPRAADGRELPEGGCQGEADRVLAAGAAVPPDQALGEKLAVEQNGRALADSRVAAAMKLWSDCMAAGGYRYDTIWQPNEEPWPEPANDREIATAVADVRCKRETNLLGTMEAVEAAYQRRAIEQHGEQLAAVQTHARALASSSARVVGGG